MPTYKFRNPVTTAPSDVQDNDAFAVKIIAVAGYGGDWAAYIGPSDWSDERVARSGDKLLKKQAEPLFCVMRHSGRHYRG